MNVARKAVDGDNVEGGEEGEVETMMVEFM